MNNDLWVGFCFPCDGEGSTAINKLCTYESAPMFTGFSETRLFSSLSIRPLELSPGMTLAFFSLKSSLMIDFHAATEIE